MNRGKLLYQYWKSFSFVALVFAALFFSASVTPSLLPRTYYVQGILSAFAVALGYGVGVSCVVLYQFLELPNPREPVQRKAKRVTTACVALIFIYFTWRMAFWQNSTRELMGMEPLETTYPFRTALITLILGAAIISFTRLIILSCVTLSNRMTHYLPRRVSLFISTTLVVTVLIFIANGIIARGLLLITDKTFLQLDHMIDDGVEQPVDALAAGSDESRIPWDTIGRQGKNFVAAGPTQKQISEFLGREAKRPLRVYVGMRSRETPAERAELALEELKRIGAFQRSLLVLVTPTGTGWLDPGGVDTIEYLHAGDTALVTTQYSYVPSWISILIDPRRSIEAADTLFDAVYRYWTTLPKDARPKLYLHGLSLGSLGSEVAADLYTIFEDPIHGAVWSGPPFPSEQWNDIVAHRNPQTPAWLPTYRDQRLVRFTAQKNALSSDQPWGPMRNVYIQYASDPMVFFSPSLFYRKPNWLAGPRGPDVSPHLSWFPMVTGLQIAFDLPMSTSIPVGHGHNYAPANYIDAWMAVTEPSGWDKQAIERLKQHFLRPAPSMGS